MEKLGPEKEINRNIELNIWEALIPIIVLVGLLAINVLKFDSPSGANQFILLIGAATAAVVGFFNGVSYKEMIDEVGKNFKNTAGAILILLMVGALAGTWLISGIIPTLIYGGLKILSAPIFLPSAVIICAVISLATGSSWTTTATVGIALIGIGGALGFSLGMVAGAVISGAYFGDKMSPLSDTTNLAPAMAGAELFNHIRYMMLTTVPTIILTLIIFTVIGLFRKTTGSANTEELLMAMDQTFNISAWLMLVPIILIFLIVRKTKPLIALFIGTILAAFFALIFQPDIVSKLGGSESLSFNSAYTGIVKALTSDVAIETTNPELNDLFTAGGMSGMLDTIWLILCALAFGGVMDAIGALSRISQVLLSMANSVFGLFASTVASCLALNVTASDQYLAIIVPGKMFEQAYKDRGLSPENLSRTLEDSGTVTSALVPWNTCGAYQSGVLGVSVADYFIYAIFNYVSPFMTLLFSALSIKIKLSGHSKWSKIKRKKGANDQKRGKVFSRVVKEISIAVKEGGNSDPDFNPRLRLAIQNAKGVNMPKENIERAIKKAEESGGEGYEELTYEGYAPGGVAIFVECLTDNTKRTVADVRAAFSKRDGNLATNGSVAFMFERKAVFEIQKGELDIDDLTLELIDAGAEDVEDDEDLITITSEVEHFGTISSKLESLSIEASSSKLERIPTVMKDLDVSDSKVALNLVDALEDLDDVQSVFHNLNMSEELAKALEEE